MFRRPHVRAISASTKETTLAAVVVLLAAWAGLSWYGNDDPAPDGPTHAARLDAASGPCDRNGSSNVALLVTTTDDAPLTPGPAQIIVRWNDTGDTGPMVCVESDADSVTAEASAIAAAPGERGAQLSVADMERDQQVTVHLGIPWPADAATTSVAVHLEPGAADDGSVLVDPAPVTVDVNHLAPPSVAAQLVGPPDGAVLGDPSPFELRLAVTDGPARQVVGRLPLADGVTVESLFADNDGECASEVDAIVCRWDAIESSASALIELVVVPGDPTCEFFVLCLDAEVTWSGETDAMTTASTEVELERRPELAVASFEVDGVRAFTVTNTSTGPVTDIEVVDPGCGPVTHTGPEVLEPAGTLVLTCGGSGSEEREVTATGLGPTGAAVTGSVVITPEA
jgi:hypothetical protein